MITIPNIMRVLILKNYAENYSLAQHLLKVFSSGGALLGLELAEQLDSASA